MNIAMNDYHRLPSIDALINHPDGQGLVAQFGRDLALQSLRETLEKKRHAVKPPEESPDLASIFIETRQTLEKWLQPSLRAVINASGIIVHTNLGRAPLSDEALDAIQAIAAEYSNLEYDLEAGRRGKRTAHAEAQLQLLTGAESALVVNNNAAAVLLTLSALASRRRVAIAHSQLVEIGGGFRVPDVMRQSGAKLAAIGTTNRVHISDYEEALKTAPALVFCAHHSNFKIVGFTTEPDIADLARVCQAHHTPLAYDLGSGALLDTARFGLGHEPTVQEAMAAGVDIVCFSGDKLLGGPQAGILVGRMDLLEKVKKHPLARAIRADKLCLAGISATLNHYLKGEALEKIPVWRMIAMTADEAKARAAIWRERLGAGEVMRGLSMVGGGSLPEESLDTFVLALAVRQPNRFVKRLREADKPVIARIEAERVTLDPRTVLPHQDEALIQQIRPMLQQERITD